MASHKEHTGGGGGRHHQGRRKGKKGRKGGGNDRVEPASLSGQPTLDTSDMVPCKICGHLVDPKRMQPHLIRFHGATGGWKGG
jgi:hypothetical protein